MSDNELWQAFLYEVTEQLEYLEKELINARYNDQELINQLFRYFHSIKSSCAMFEFTAMEEIAHAAESILDQVRKGISPVSDELIGVLLGSVDCLKEQLAEGEATQQPPQRNRRMLELLLSCINEDAPRQAFNAEESENTLGIDAVEMEEVAEISVVMLQRFFQALAANDNESAIKALQKWLLACEALQFTQLSLAVSQLVQLVESDNVRDTALSLTVCAQIMDQLQSLEELSGQAFALDSLHAHFDAFFSEHYHHVLQALQQHLALCVAELQDGNAMAEEDLDSLCEVIDEVLKFYKVFGFGSSRDLLRYFNQVCRKSILGQQTLDVNVFAMLYSVVQAHLQAAGNYSMQLQVEAECGGYLVNFRQQLNQDDNALFRREQRLQALTSLLEIPAGYLDYIDNSEIEALEYCLQAGKTTALLLVDMEADREWSHRFAHWLNDAEIITSRTVFCQRELGGQVQEYTKTSFLLVFDSDPESIRQSLAQIKGSAEHIESLVFKTTNKRDAGFVAVTPPPPVVPEAAITARAEKIDNNKSIRIGSDVIDRFVVQIGEMVLQRNMLSHAIHDKDIDSVLKKCKTILGSSQDGSLKSEQIEDLKESLGSLGEFFDGLVSANNKLTQSVSFVQEEVMSLRVVPISIVFNRLPRIVRHINSEYDKDIRLEISGEHVRVDKSMVDVLMEPLVHLVRNCADHGIENRSERQRLGKTAAATITVSAEQSGNMLLIKVMDNGAGLNYSKIRDKAVRLGMMAASAAMDEDELKQLIFAPGFSTSEILTETSGRGVGMDAVKSSLAAIGGSIDVQSQAGKGTTFTLKLPVSAAIQGVVVFRHQGETLTIPERNVVFGLSVPVEELQTVQGQAAFIYQGDIIPVYGVGELLHWSVPDAGSTTAKTEQEILIITDDSHHMGLAVDKVIGRQEIFVRDLHSDLMSLPGVGGASILGNGEVVLILNCEALMGIASRNSHNIETLLKVS